MQNEFIDRIFQNRFVYKASL